MRPHLLHLAAVVVVANLSVCARGAVADDPLTSWNAGPVKARILAFVQAVTDKAGGHYVPPAERIAVFDNDGTLWAEQPMYFQLAFALDRVKALGPRHPEWKDKQPYKAALEGDMQTLAAGGMHGMIELVMATHAAMTTEEFEQIVRDWLSTANHPRLNRPYTDLVYQPMLELLSYLRANGFKTYIVSGGGVEFMRPWVEQTYGIPPEQVIGSSIRTQYEVRDGKPVLVRLPEMNFIDDKEGKPVGINLHIGRRPIAAFGNSDGDFQMLEWTSGGPGKRLAVIVHHDDGEREFAYDRKSSFGKLDRGLDEAPKRGWSIISMKNDWKHVFSPLQVEGQSHNRDRRSRSAIALESTTPPRRYDIMKLAAIRTGLVAVALNDTCNLATTGERYGGRSPCHRQGRLYRHLDLWGFVLDQGSVNDGNDGVTVMLASPNGKVIW